MTDETHPAPGRGMFIALEGGNGIGKTTLARGLAELDYETAVDSISRGGSGLVWVSRRQPSRTSTYAATLMDHLSTILWHSGDDPVLSDGFWASTQAAWFTAHSETVIGPLIDAGFDVIVDGWLGRFTAQLLNQGYDESALDAVFGRVRIPDAAIVLELDSARAYERSIDLRPSELGMHVVGALELNRDSFIAHQERTADTLRALATERGWHIHRIDSADTPEQVRSRIAPIVAEIRNGLSTPDARRTSSAETEPTILPQVRAREPHYRWPAPGPGLQRAVLAQVGRSLSDRDSSGVIGEFEAAFATFIGARHAVSFASGTAAIHAMSRISGLRPGDEVIAPAYTFFATASPFAAEGISVRFADSDPETGNVTADTIEAAITPTTKAVIVTHMWGVPCDMNAITALCTARGLLLFEDCSHAHFASWNGQRVGTFGDMAVFSTNQKAITTGEGGVLVTDSDTYRDKALLFGHYNKRCLHEIDSAAPYYAYAFTGMGLKERITTLGAAIGVHELARATEIEARRRIILDRYRTGLSDNPVLSTVPVDPGSAHGLYALGLRFQAEAASVGRDEFVDMCHAAGAIEVDVPGSTRDISGEPLFARPDPFAPWSSPTPRPRQQFPGVTAFADRFIKLPLWGYPGDEPVVASYLAVLQHLSSKVAK